MLVIKQSSEHRSTTDTRGHKSNKLSFLTKTNKTLFHNSIDVFSSLKSTLFRNSLDFLLFSKRKTRVNVALLPPRSYIFFLFHARI